MTTAAIYARVSTDEQATKYSLDSQVKRCQEYVSEKSYTLAVDPFLEDYTGTAMDRPQLDKIRELAREGKIERLVCLELDRLGRGLVVPLIIEDEFKKLGTSVEYVQEVYEDTPEGSLKKGIRATISEYERVKLLQRTQRGRKEKAEGGSVMSAGVPKYGYERFKDGKKTYYAIVSDEAAVVALIFQWCAIGDERGQRLKSGQITRRLTELRIPTRMDKLGGKFLKVKNVRSAKSKPFGQWDRSVVMNILRDKTYTGRAHNGACEFEVPQIIPPELWQDAQRQLDANKVSNRRNNTRSAYLMRSRLRCAKCNKVFQYNDPHGRNITAQYRCDGTRSNRMAGFERICSGIYRQPDIDEQVWAKIAELLKNPDLILETYRRDKTSKIEPLQERLGVIVDLLRADQGRQAKLLREYLDGELPKELLDREAAEIKARIAAYELEKGDIEARLRPIALDEGEIENLVAYCKDIAVAIDDFTFDERRRVIELLDIRGLVSREGNDYTIHITGHIPQQNVTVSGTIGSPIKAKSA